MVAQIGAAPPSTLILAANPLRKWCLVTAALANANNVYLGAADTVTNVVGSFFDMMAGGSWGAATRGPCGPVRTTARKESSYNRARKAILSVLFCGLACGQAVESRPDERRDDALVGQLAGPRQ